MKTELDRKLVEGYPELYRTARGGIWGFECRDGWYNIIDNLSWLLTADIRRAKEQVTLWTNLLDTKLYDGRIVTQDMVDAMMQESNECRCPVALQVKEKFGGLEFYVDRANDIQQSYITFARLMSYRTCEVCGSPGMQYPLGWTFTLCDKHADEQYGGDAVDYRNKMHKCAKAEQSQN